MTARILHTGLALLGWLAYLLWPRRHIGSDSLGDEAPRADYFVSGGRLLLHYQGRWSRANVHEELDYLRLFARVQERQAVTVPGGRFAERASVIRQTVAALEQLQQGGSHASRP
jgi:hypothetical protein